MYKLTLRNDIISSILLFQSAPFLKEAIQAGPEGPIITESSEEGFRAERECVLVLHVVKVAALQTLLFIGST